MPDQTVETVLEIYALDSGARRVVHRARQHFEAPNWSRDGRSLLVNGGGRLYTLPIEGGAPTPVDCGIADQCNNDHGFSPDGRWLAISHEPRGPGGQPSPSLIYVLPAAGGAPRLVTPLGPSYFHGWSPDGETLAACAGRGGQLDIYTIPARGGAERRLTDGPGLDDGPDYSPDGRTIFFNSERTGVMRIWRMRPDGSDQRQVTFDDAHADWFPHPSPDGRWLVFLSYDGAVAGHPPNRAVTLRLMPLAETPPAGPPRIIAELCGGQGTLNVPSWSPDSRRFAFVSYRLVGDAAGAPQLR